MMQNPTGTIHNSARVFGVRENAILLPRRQGLKSDVLSRLRIFLVGASMIFLRASQNPTKHRKNTSRMLWTESVSLSECDDGER